MINKLKSYEFWVSVVGVLTVVLQGISTKLDIPYISQTMMTLLGALALGGILKRSSKPETNDDNTGEETDGKEGREE
mgnify:CR=1 FL=1